ARPAQPSDSPTTPAEPRRPWWRRGALAASCYLPPLDRGTGLAGGAALTNRWRGLAAGACPSAVLTRGHRHGSVFEESRRGAAGVVAANLLDRAPRARE